MLFLSNICCHPDDVFSREVPAYFSMIMLSHIQQVELCGFILKECTRLISHLKCVAQNIVQNTTRNPDCWATSWSKKVKASYYINKRVVQIFPSNLASQERQNCFIRRSVRLWRRQNFSSGFSLFHHWAKCFQGQRNISCHVLCRFVTLCCWSNVIISWWVTLNENVYTQKSTNKKVRPSRDSFRNLTNIWYSHFPQNE